MRSVFFVSDSTAMTAKGLGKSLLSQFENLSYIEYFRPYVDSDAKVNDLIAEIRNAEMLDGKMPIIFASMMDEDLMRKLHAAVINVIDIFAPFVPTLEGLIAEKSSKAVGRAHNVSDSESYKHRILAIDFTMATDDGLKISDYDQADIILLGVSRTGKTPTALYLAFNFGLKVANYPFTGDDLPHFALNEAQKKNRHKLIGLMISPERLVNIRQERRPNSNYADYFHVNRELEALRDLFEREKIFFVDASTRSVEEIAATIMNIFRLRH